MKSFNIKFQLTTLLVFISLALFSQNIAITDDDSYTANSSAMLDVKSLTKGFLAPRMTTAQRNAIASPAAGLLVYDTSVGGYYYYNGSSWVNLTSGATSGPFWSYNSPNIYMSTTTDKLGLGTSSPLHKLHLYENIAITDGTDGNFIDIQNSNNSNGVMGGIRFQNGTTANTFKGGIFYRDVGSFGTGDLILANNTTANQSNVSAADGRIILQQDGRVLVKGDPNLSVNEAIFAVQNSAGDTIFAVYPEGVRIWVNDDGAKATGSRGGFAVGGFSPSKAGFTNEYLRVTPDSVRVYINDAYTANKATGSRGGFAVGGFSPTKGITNNYLFVQDDSTRVYVNGNEGFAVDNLDVTDQGRYMDMTPRNYFIGHHSGENITTGAYNSFFGYQTGFNATTANRNILIGYQAGYNNNSDENNFIGYQAGYNNSTGTRNNFIGYLAGYSNTTGDRNTFVGTSAGYSNIDGQYNSLFGHYAGYNAQLNNNNILIGFYAGYNADNTDDNIYIGSGAGYGADNSNNSIAIGTYSGYNNNGENNLFIGSRSGYNNTDGTKNIFLGYYSGYSNQSGDKNVFIGNNAGYSNISGYNNIFIGDTCGSHNTASNNIFIGSGAGRDNSTGSNNIFVGTNAGLKNTNGVGNTYIGWAAGSNNNGSNNVMIGYWSGLSTTAGEQNTFIGQGAGVTNTGNDNIFIGYAAGNNDGDNCIFIGNQIHNINKDNILVIEGLVDETNPLIYGEFDNNLLGINTANPSANLHIKQSGVGEEGLAIENDSNTDTWSWEIGSNDLFFYFNGTSVGYWDDATGNYVAISDKNLKKDIEVFNKPVLDGINNLQLVSYRLNHAESDSKKTIGFIAQDVQKYFPEIVYQREDGYLGLNYDDFGILAIKAIQEQQNIINDLLEKDKQKEQQINELKNEIEELRNMIKSK
ncbi:MAG: hypothetical protein Kow0068_01250 [Marinilabiliales bacterium]